MSESKIGKWMTRDGRTAVVFAEDRGQLFGVIRLLGSDLWGPTNWKSSGSSYIDGKAGSDLVRKVSDSTDLTPYVPVKRVRPWTRAEVEAIVQQRPLLVRLDKESKIANLVTVLGDLGVEFVGGEYRMFKVLADQCVQLDGSPCGVEVEE